MKIAWGITGSGDLLPETIVEMREIARQCEETRVYVFLSKAARFVLKWYGLGSALENITKDIFFEVDANATDPFYYLPGALQLHKFDFFIICPGTANTVAKIVRGIADTLISNAVAQAAKANVPIYILPVDNKQGKIETRLPSGEKLELETRQVDIENTIKLSKMKNIHVFTHPSEIAMIFRNHGNALKK